MSIAVIGKKIGMIRVFDENGNHLAVTVVEVTNNTVTQIKTVKKDKYSAIQICYGRNKASRLNKPDLGLYAKTGVEVGRGLVEFRVEDTSSYKVNDVVSLDIFDNVTHVDATAVSKGKGFQGGVKRHNFHMQDATHGNSVSHRAIGSTGQNQSPGKVFKGKKMPGQMGNKQVTVMSQKLVRVDKEKNLILVSGTVPGGTGGFVKVKAAVKVK